MVSEKLFWLSCQARTDVGLGHLSRCVALAEELNSRGYETCFAHFSELDARGQSLLLNSDLSLTCECTGFPVAVICDSYDLNFIAKIDLGTNSKLVLLADDVSLPFNADAYIEASPIKAWVPLNEKVPVFRFDANPILRKQFDASTISFDFDSPFDLMMTFGAAKESKFILNSLIPIIAGSTLFNRKVTLLTTEGLNSNDLVQYDRVEIEVFRGTYNLRDLVNNKTFVISAAGVTAWELITLGVPGFLIAVAENQYEQLEYFKRLGLREGVVYRNTFQLATEVNRLVAFGNFIKGANEAKCLVRNGRVESINWLLEKVLNYPNHQE